MLPVSAFPYWECAVYSPYLPTVKGKPPWVTSAKAMIKCTLPKDDRLLARWRQKLASILAEYKLPKKFTESNKSRN